MKKFSSVREVLRCTPGRGGTLLYGLNRDVRPDRVWFSEGFVSLERGVDFINFCLKQGIVTRPYVFINLQKPHKKPNFLPVCQCTAY